MNNQELLNQLENEIRMQVFGVQTGDLFHLRVVSRRIKQPPYPVPLNETLEVVDFSTNFLISEYELRNRLHFVSRYIQEVVENHWWESSR